MSGISFAWLDSPKHWVLLGPMLAISLSNNPTLADEVRQAPAFEIPVLGKSETMRLEDLRGQHVLVDFWASWCTPCAKSFPFMDELLKRYADQGLAVVAISVDERSEDALRFADRLQPRFPLLHDPDGSWAERFALKGMPSSYLIDPQGQIIEEFVGFRSGEAERMESAIADALGDVAR